MWTKIFCPQNSGKNQGFRGRKNAPDLNDQEHFYAFGVKTLLQRLLNSDSHGNGHTDHGVVTSAQEAHHFHIKPHLRWCLHWDTTTFSAGNPIFHKTRSTSFESMMMCFPSLGTSYHIMCSRNKCFNLNYTPRTSFIIFSHLLRSTKSNEAFPILSASKNKLKKDFLFADLSNNIG